MKKPEAQIEHPAGGTAITQAEQNKLKSYLLGTLSEADEEQIELRLLTDDVYFKELEIIEDELIDQYVHETLPAAQRAQLEQHFLRAPERQHKLAFAIALDAESSAQAAALEQVAAHPAAKPLADQPGFFSSLYLKVAAVLVITLGIGYGVWVMRTGKSDVEQGMVALNEAYKHQRLVEARISTLNYAPFRQLRGNDQPDVDTAAHDRAERLLLDARHAQPNTASLHALGRLYLAEGKFDKAKDQFDQALAQDQNNAQLHSDMGAVLLELGKRERTNDAGKSFEYFAQSLEHLNKALALNAALPEALFNRALVYQRMMLLPQAKDAWRKYLEKDATSPWADEARRNLAALEEQGKKATQKKEQLYETFIRAYQDGDAAAAWSAIGQSRSRAGNLIVERLLDEHLDLATRGQNQQADVQLRLLSFAGEVEAQQVGDRYTADLAAFYARADKNQCQRLMRARHLTKFANERYNKAEFEAAIALYAEAARRFEQTGDAGEALFAESWLGYCELRLADNQSQLRFERLARIYEEKSYKSLLAQSLHALSDAETSVNELSKALDYAGRALKLSELIQDDATKLRCLQQFVSMHLRFGNYLEALKYGFGALELAPAFASDPKLMWTFYHQVALDFYWLNLPASALEFEKEALRLAEESGWPFIIVRSYTQLGFIYEQRHEYDEAIQSGVRALAEGQNVAGEKSRLNILSHAAMRLGHLYRQTGDFNDALRCYDEALRMFEQLDLSVFLYEAHKGKFMTLAALGDNAAADSELAQALRLFEQYRSKIQEERNRDSFFDVGQDIYDLAIDFAYVRQGDPAKAFDYAEASRARSLLNLMHTRPQMVDKGEGPDLHHISFTHPAPLSELRDQLPDHIQLLQYAALNDKLIIWLVTRAGLETRVVPISADDLRQKVAAYTRQVVKGETDEGSKRAAEALYDILISPVESQLSEESQLCIVPDKALFNLPYGALISPTTGRFFIQKYCFVISPSANIFATCTEIARQKEGTGGERLLSVGNPSFARRQFPELPELSSAGREAAEVAAYYKTVPLLGKQARESQVRAGLLAADVAHLASHYVINERSPMLSELLLAEEPASPAQHEADGLLQAFEVYGMKLPRTRLVVLSACQTGIERSYQGEGAIGIARSFISAGVPLVVASLWPVESDATAELMISFHRYRKLTGLSAAAALRRAQLDMIGSPDEGHRRPYVWAAFIVFGGYAEF